MSQIHRGVFVSTKMFQLSYIVINLDNFLFPGLVTLLDGTLDSKNSLEQVTNDLSAGTSTNDYKYSNSY